jgi:glycosyltransferase involved in cell wall biosynthesis
VKIVIINNLYAPWVRGGSDKVVERIVAGLEKAGHEVFIITTAPKESRTEKIHYLQSIFYNLDRYPLATRFFWHLFDSFNFLKAAEVKNILKEEKPDLVITNNLMGLGFLLPRLLKKLKIRHVHILHDIQLLHPSGLMFWGKEKILASFHAKIYQAINRALFGSPEVVVSPSKWLLDEHLKRGFFKKSLTKVLPNYFKDTGFKAQDAAVKNEFFTFFYVGQIEDHKGVNLLVETFINFLEKNFKADLIIVGPGSRLEEIKKLAVARPEIKVLGRKNSVEVAEFMRKSDCLVVPSLCYENSPTVIYEAIASGLPVIGARIGGITELIEIAGGILFKPDNQADLLEKMKLVFTHPEESDRIIAKETAYQPPDYISELLSL